MTMTEKVEPHTPLPWRREHEYIVSENGIAHASFDYTLDANYSILACNSYPALLAERDRLREAVEEATRHIERTLESSMPLKGVDGAGVPYADRLQYARDFVEHAHALIKDTNQ